MEDPLDVISADKENERRMSIERIYQKKSQLEHILLRPDTYIGSIEYTDRAPMWVYDSENERIVQREISYVPGLYKIFDEILVNAADNKQRDPKMNVIKITIDKDKNEISVYNNGRGIPVVLHKVEKVYVPELIFGTLLTSSNYDDSERKVTGGRNGYGAKLCNVFSKRFTIETSSKEYGKSFKQSWVDNMKKDGEAVIGECKGDDYTRITFRPDLAKFKMHELDDDIVALMSRRAYDVAGSCRGVKVFLNHKQLPVQGFKQYVEQYVKNNKNPSTGEPYSIIYERFNDRWEVALTVSERGFQQVSFVNSIATMKGGRHVDYIVDQVTAKLIDIIKKKIGKSGGVNVKPFQIRNHMWIFVNALIENPTFDSQTKETMTLQSKSFGSKCELTEKFMQSVLKCGVVESVMAWVKFKQQESLDKKCSAKRTTRLKGLPKLEDANDAGTKNSALCTLILTEGDSAKSLAVSGLGVIGRDKYGVFPLRGKMLNVREGNHKQVAENTEVNALLKIVGLQYRLKYEKDDEMKTLRYGKIMVMADQDQDGSHIKGLVINFIHYNWPALIKRSFVEEFITPIVKATKGKEGRSKEEYSFFSLPEYAEWRNNTENWKTYRIKYYKGLGTSTSKEAKEYFSDMKRHRIKFRYDGEEDDRSLDMAFSKKRIEDRKVWLTNWMAVRKDRREQGLTEEYLYDKDTQSVSFKDFVNKELVLFSNMDNERSIPSLVDGLKPGQRKVMFTCFKRADKKEIKVAQLAGAVGEMSAYHHGEASLMMTIVNLAQDYVGSNNINLLLPIGQFGTRLQGGKDSASPRYIFTQLNPVTRALFPSVDEHVLRFLHEENQRIEPEWYCPIIPMVLVNGAEGIGTAWSTKVPNYNPREIVDNIRRMIRGEQPNHMVPWFKNFRGTILEMDDNRYVCNGEISIIDENTLEISELPIRTWTQAYKETVLEPMLDGTDKQPAMITDFKEYHTDTTVKFVVKMPPEKLRAAEAEGLHKVFKLQTVINTTSMVLFDALGCLRRFNTVEDIFSDFYEIRKKKYIERKAFQVGMLRAQSERLSNQARFILKKIKGEIQIENKRKAVIVEQLVSMGFDPDPVKKWKELQKKKEMEATGEIITEEGSDGENEENEGEEGEHNQKEPKNAQQKDLESKLSDYDYLVGMAIVRLSSEEKDKLLRESGDKLEELKTLEETEWSDLWMKDLDNFIVELDKQEAKEKADQEIQIKNVAKKLAKEIIGIGRKKKADTSYIAKEALPDPNGIRVEPKIDSVKEKYESKKASKPRQPKSEPKKEGADVRKFMKKTNDVNNDKDAPPHSRKDGKKKKKFELDSSEESEDDFIETLDDDIQQIIPSKTNDVEIGEKRKSDEADKEMAPVTKKSKETEPSKAIKITKKKMIGKDNPTIARSPQTSMTDFFGKKTAETSNKGEDGKKQQTKAKKKADDDNKKTTKNRDKKKPSARGFADDIMSSGSDDDDIQDMTKKKKNGASSNDYFAHHALPKKSSKKGFLSSSGSDSDIAEIPHSSKDEGNTVAPKASRPVRATAAKNFNFDDSLDDSDIMPKKKATRKKKAFDSDFEVSD